jgi:hypothetical protein
MFYLIKIFQIIYNYCISFCVVLLEVFEGKELNALQGALVKWKNPLKWIGYLKTEFADFKNKIEKE